MASGSGAGTIQLFNTVQPTQVPRSFNAHEGGVTSLKFVPGKNAMVSAGLDNKVKFWDLLTNQNTVILQDANGISDIDVSPSGQTVICGSAGGKLMQYTFSSSKATTLFTGNSAIMAVAYDYEGEKIAVGDRSGKIYILNAVTGKILNTLNGHSSRVIDLQFSPDNRQLASSGLDGVIRIWNITNLNDLPLEIRENENWVETLAFSPDGKSLLSSGNNNNIYIWPVRTDNLANEICSYLTRQMTQQEWNTYIGNDMEYREACK
jgi:WD40 repeat protein